MRIVRKSIGRIIGFIAFAFGCFAISVSVLLVSTGVINPRAMFPNLPEPPEIDTRGLPRISENIPEGTVPEITLPGTSGESTPLSREVRRRPLTSTIPAPQQVVTAPRVVGTNLFLTILMALIFGSVSTVMGNMIRDEEPRIRAWLRAYGIEKPLEWIRKAFQWTASGRIRQGCLTLPLVALILALYGVIFAFLEEGTSLFSREGIFLAVAMAFSVGMVSFAGDIARRILAAVWREKSHFNLYPANLVIAVGTVIFSRLFSFSPGLAFGSPGGADVDMREDDPKYERREVTLSIVTLGILAGLVALGWIVSGVVLNILSREVDVSLVEPMANVLTPIQNTALILFLVAIETLFFESLPLTYGTGQTIFQKSKILWAVIFLPVAFLFNHTLLNPQSGFLDSFMTANVRILWVFIFLLTGVTAVLWFYFNVVDDILSEWAGVRR